MNQIFHMILRQVLNRLIRKGVDAGFDRATGQNGKGRRQGDGQAGQQGAEMTPRERRQMRQARQQARQQRQQMKALRKLNRF